MKDIFGWCVIGCGKLAGIVAEQILASGRHKIVSVYGRNAERCAAFADKYGAAAAKTAAEAMEMPGVEGVYVVTTHTSHYEYTKMALERSLPVLCEKPLTVNARDARELAALARKNHTYFAEAMWTWFAPAANGVKQWLDEGAFGEITRVRLDCRVDGRGYAPRVTDPAAAGGALLDMGVYALTYLYRLFGKPEKIACKGILADGIDLEEDVTFFYADGTRLDTGIAIADPKGAEVLQIEGTKARMSFSNFHYAEQAELIRDDGTKEVRGGSGDYLNEFDRVVEEIRQGLTESRYEPMQVTLDVMEIMDECRRQMGLLYPFETAQTLARTE